MKSILSGSIGSMLEMESYFFEKSVGANAIRPLFGQKILQNKI